jgi:hypothetical protein
MLANLVSIIMSCSLMKFLEFQCSLYFLVLLQAAMIVACGGMLKYT